MLNKINNKHLALIFVALLLVFAILKIIDINSGEGTFPDKVLTIDSAQITGIHIYRPNSSPSPIKLSRTQDRWQVTFGNKQRGNAHQPSIQRALKQLTTLTPRHLATRSPEKWNQFKVDSTGIRIKLLHNNKKTSVFYLGKFSFDKKTRTTTAYIRKSGENAVYAVPGMINMTFNRKAQAWRDGTIIKGQPQQWTELQYNYTNNKKRSFALTHKKDNWFIKGQGPADSTAVKEYLSSIKRLTNKNFADSFTPDQLSNPTLTLSIHRKEQSPIKIKAYPADTTHHYLFTSSQNPGTVFSGSDKALRNKILVKAKKFSSTKADTLP